jgi:hypothetical protein
MEIEKIENLFTQMFGKRLQTVKIIFIKFKNSWQVVLKLVFQLSAIINSI